MKMIRFIGAAALAVGAVLSTGCAEIIEPGHRGVEINLGEVNEQVLPEGLVWYNPLTQDILEVEVRTQVMKAQTSTYTKDVQSTDLVYTVNFNLDPSAVVTTYKEAGLEWQTKLVPQVIEDTLKSVIGSYSAETLIEKRAEAREKILSALKPALAQRKVVLTGFEINDISYSEAFEQAVENKAVAVQNALAEQNRTVQVKEKSDQTVIAAQAEAESMRIRANALAQNQKLVEWEAVQKWDGKLPQYMLGGNTTPFINIK